MNIVEITDSELQEFCRWYKNHYGRSESYESVEPEKKYCLSKVE